MNAAHRPDRVPVRDIVAMLADRLDALCVELLPLGHREGRYWIEARRANGGLGDSLKVHLAGERRGKWRHFAADVGGDALDLVAYLKGLDKHQAIEWAKAWLDLDGDAPPPRSAPAARPQPPAADHAGDTRQRLEAAMKIWREARPATGTLVEVYLAARGITIPPPPSLRYAPALRHGPTNFLLACMVGGIQGVDRSIIGIHRTFLKMDGSAKAAVSTPKMSLGPIGGGAVRLGPARSPLAIAEGIETALAVAQACPEFSVWAAISTAGLKAIEIPLEVREVVIMADGDEPGQKAAASAAARLTSEGHEARVVRAPDGQDFADLLNQGAAA